MHQFYTDDSEYTFAVGSEDPQIVKGKEAIFNKMCELYFDDVYVDIASGSVDTQSSQGDNVMIMVTGTFSCKGRSAKPFVQTMLLSKKDTSYFVMNDVFRLLDKDALIKSCEMGKVRGVNRTNSPLKKKEEEKKKKKATTNSTTTATATKPTVVVEETKKVSMDEVAVVATASTKEAKGEPLNEGATKKKKKKKKSEAKKKVVAASPKNASPKSWKDLLINSSSGSTSNDKTTSAPPAARKTTTTGKTVSVAKSGKKGNTSQMAEMFLGNVGPDTTEKEVKAIYEVFGAMEDVKLLPDRKHGFFKFQKMESARKALKAQESGKLKSKYKIELRKKKQHGNNKKNKSSGRK